MRVWSQVVLVAVLVAPAVGVAAMQGPFDHGNIGYATTAPTDAIAQLQKKLDSGEVTLKYDPEHGYVPAVLDELKIPRTSQSLVFSKTSLQLLLISPKRPRAIYFNDDVYIGSVQGSPLMEVAAIDPRLGTVFYTLEQKEDEKPRFQREFFACLLCHDTAVTSDVPGLMTLSVLTDRDGNAIPAAGTAPMSDRTPFKDRFGGWYVTGTHGAQQHWGNLSAPIAKESIGNVKDYLKRLNLEPGSNVTSLKSRIDAKYYLTPESDITAVMVLTHQTRMHNLITRARYDVESAGDDKEKIRLAVEPLVRGMLFVWEAGLEAPVAGTTSFAADFAKAGPHDRQGRSLRELDLKTRLLKYPLSYLVYSKQFEGLQPAAKRQFFSRVRDIVTRRDTNKDFDNLSEENRKAIFEILSDTSPEFAALTNG